MNIFLSYSQKDQKLAHALSAGLSEAGYEVLDPANEISPGENWHLQLGKALERSDAMVVLLSPDALASHTVRSDIEYALSSSQFRDRLIPVLVRPTAEIPWILRKRQFIRVSKNLDETVRAVAAALKKTRPAVAS